MALTLQTHPDYPQPHQVEQILSQLHRGAVMLYPTDTVYAIGCDALNKGAVERVRQLKRLSNDKPLTLLCSSLSDIATYAYVSDTAYRLMRHLIPGPYTFLLPATKVVPKLVLNPKRKTAGIRVPDHPLCQDLLKSLGNPIISTSAKLDGEPIKVLPLDPRDMDEITKQVDLVVDDQSPYRSAVSTVIDLTEDEPVVLRRGLGYETVDYLPYREDAVPV